MKRTIIVCGYGPGISDAVARRFAQEGYAVALVARNAARLAAAERSLTEAGGTARAFPCDLGDTAAVRALVEQVRATLGPVAVVHWNAYAPGAGDLTTANVEALRASLDVSLHGMLAATQAALPDLRSEQGAYDTLQGFLRLCDLGGPNCAFSDGNPKRRFDRLAKRLLREPAEFTDPTTGETFVVTYAELIGATLGAVIGNNVDKGTRVEY